MPRVVTADLRTTTAALSLLYGRWPAVERQSFVRDALAAAARGRLDLRHLIVALDDSGRQVLGAALAVERPGREAVVRTPGIDPNVESTPVGRALLEELSRRLEQSGLVCAVAFVDPGDTPQRELFESAGFPGIADLCLLRCDPQTLLHRPVPDRLPLVSIPWSGDLEGLFADTIATVQSDGLDCPEVGSLRTGFDVLASHAAQSALEPALWQLFRRAEEAEPIGVLLLADHQSREELEVLYVGVVPAARRQGVARAMLSQARRIARERRRTSLTVAVESRNLPALALYAGEQFHETRRYAIHLRVHPHAASSAP